MVALAKLVNIKGGGTPSKSVPEYWEGEIPWASVKDFKSSVIDKTIDSISRSGVENSATSVIPAGTIVIPTRMAVGKVAVLAVDMAINQDLKALVIKDESIIDKRFLLRFLQSQEAYLLSHAKGATVKGITLDVLKELEVPLLPIAEQKRIADILDKADNLRRKRQQAIQLAEEFLRAVFLDMFGDPIVNRRGWDVAALGESLEFLTSGSRGWAKYYADNGAPFIRIQNVSNGRLLLNDLAFVNPPQGAEADRTRVRPGDVLLSITADLGRTAVVTDAIAGGHINQHLALLRPDVNKVHPRYLASYLSSSSGVRQFAAMNKSAVKAGLNFNDIRTFQLAIPPMEKQVEYSSIYDKTFKMLEKSNSSNVMLENLFHSTSQLAFSGNL